jgi:catalase
MISIGVTMTSFYLRRLVCLTATTLISVNAYGVTVMTNWESYTQGEEQEAADVANDLIGLIQAEYRDQGKRTMRDAHPRGIGCAAARFTVNSDLPQKYRTGVFATPGQSYDAIVRFSSSLGPVGDQKPDARGLAIKLFDVPGTKLLEDQPQATTHDFLMINFPIFPAPNTHAFAGLIKIRKDPKSIVSYLLESPIGHALVLKNALSLTSGNPNNGKSLAAMEFFSQTPYLLSGPAVNSPVKYSVRPCQTVASRPLNGSDTELRDDLQERLDQGSLCYKFALQFFVPNQGMDVEDASREWKQDKAPFVDFATIEIPPQTFRTDKRLAYCDALSFQPWHAIAQHQPLGNINRARKSIYEAISNYRHKANIEAGLYPEPTSLVPWNDLKDPTYREWQDIKVPATRD